jgi:adenylosuccinate synthase
MNHIQYVDIVLGCSYGDEGKGKVVHSLLTTFPYDLCVRFNGSGNAGHTIYVNQQKVVLHQVPIGILKPHIANYIASDCLIHIEKLRQELTEISKVVGQMGPLMISKSCHIITEEAIQYDKQNNLIGTTGSGIGPTYANKMLRIGKRAENFEEQFRAMGITLVDPRKFFFTTTYNKILLEGAQGFELDINWTNHYPFCTSSTCTLAGAINTGIPISKIRNVYGVSKAYDTYVGNRVFQPLGNIELEKIGIKGQEFGATTGRKRQCNYLNLDNLIEALQINQCNNCIINKMDILTDLKIYKLYHGNQLITFHTHSDMMNYIMQHLNFVTVYFSNNPYGI